MPKYRKNLPQLDGDIFLTDGGIETTLLFLDGYPLPHFAAFDLMKSHDGREHLRSYYRRYATIATDNRLGFVLEAPTWRSNPDWGTRLGYSAEALDAVNRGAIDLLDEVRGIHETAASPMVISGCLGPRGDGYHPDRLMEIEEAERYHGPQIRAFRDAGADLVTAITMNYVEEAAGIARAAADAEMPVVISFTVETNGRLVTGTPLGEAIGAVDQASEWAPAYYMINCAHPTHFAAAIDADEGWVRRIRGLRANASRLSHAELDAATELDSGNPADLAARYADLKRRHPGLCVLGGCCGTDHRHLTEICLSCTAVA